ncbi:MAG TPA: hypothetical protein PKM50_03570 [Methanoregula sp.]|nr:hypothetical protein [Methanoregula sp.]
MEIGPATTVGTEVWVDPAICHRSHRCRIHPVCVDMCSMGVFVKIKGDYVYPEKSELCCMCFSCHSFCPVHAITVRWTLRP